MGIENEFIKLMGLITGENAIDMDDNMEKHKDILEKNCQKIQNEISGGLTVDIENGYEPCPFCCSRRDEKAKMVWVGINPGGAVERYKKFSWKESTWRDIVDYCIPKDIRKDDSIYKRLIDSNGKLNGYYQFILRVHMQLQDDWPCEGMLWSDLEAYYKDNGGINVKETFLNYFYEKPVLTADLIPYKSCGIKMTGEGLIEDVNYIKYFRYLMEVIKNYSADDAWIVFFKQPSFIKDLFDKFAKYWYPPQGTGTKYEMKSGKGTQIYVYRMGKRKIVLMPFIQTYNMDTKNLIKEINEKMMGK